LFRSLQAPEQDCSVKVEIDLDVDLHGDRLAILHRRLKAPLANSLNRFLVETHAERTLDAELFRSTVWADDRPKNHRPLVLGFAASSEYSGSGS
jgi:hypothetical protein